MSPTPESPPPPSQVRSRQTLERVLRATEALLEGQLFEELSVARIAREAGVAVGTVYTRFQGKDDLLPALFARHDAAVAGRVGALLEGLAAEPRLDARVRRVVAFAVDYHVRHRGLLRALTHYVRAHPDSVSAATWRERGRQYAAVAQVLVGDGRGVRGDDPLAQAEFALGVVNSVCREQVLFDDVTPLRGRRTSRAALKERLARLVLHDLTSR